MNAVTFAASATAAAVALLVSGPGLGQARSLGAVRVRRTRGSASRSPGVTTASRRTAAALVALALVVLVGLPSGLFVGLTAGFGTAWFLGRLEPLAVRRRRAEVTRDLPMALDLLAACLDAGTPTVHAVRAVADGVGGELGNQLSVVVAALELGAGGEAWTLLSEPQLQPIGRALGRATASGAPVADIATELAIEHRAHARTAADAAAARAGIAAVAPLGVCFLPAFVLVAVVPVVAGLASELLV